MSSMADEETTLDSNVHWNVSANKAKCNWHYMTTKSMTKMHEELGSI